MAKRVKFRVENCILTEEREDGLIKSRDLQDSWPDEQSAKPWLLLVGDCYFTGIFEDFEDGELRSEDCPRTIAVYGGKVHTVMEYVKERIPDSTKMVVVHLGANNIASTYTGEDTASCLFKLWSKICETNKNLEEIAFCFLSPRIVDKGRHYPESYICSFNKEVASFNKTIRGRKNPWAKFTVIDFGIDSEDIQSLLRESGFGVNAEGRKLMAESLRSLIKFKVDTSRDKSNIPKKWDPIFDGKTKRVVLRHKEEEVNVSFYDMPHGPLRLSLGSESYPESKVPALESDGFKSKKRASKSNYGPRRKSFRKSLPDG